MQTTNDILLVDDEVSVTAALKRALLDEEVVVNVAGSGEDALCLFESTQFKVVISDECMPGMDGAEFLSRVKERYPQTVRIMLTGHASLKTALKAVNSGEIYRFFTKPWNNLELVMAVRSAIEKYDLEEENRRLLKAIRCQAGELKALESKYPGITALEKDECGNLLIPEIPEGELRDIINQCCKGYIYDPTSTSAE